MRKIKKTHRYQLICPNCGRPLEVPNSDGKTNFDLKYTRPIKNVRCKICGNRNHILRNV